ncbi:MAG: beta-galactosidase, partial [Armatimonadetes bacterium]|nr:beta-galactosidase [Armatimonadota bacterium]
MIKTAILVALALLTGTAAMSAETQNSFKIADGQFLLNGKPFTFRSGEMHPSRIPYQYWRQRIQMAKACGLNSLGVYIMWNMHEPEKGKFSFSGQNDIAKFCKIAQEEGLYVILRPGPYVCAEWDFGGFPYWLLTEPGMTIRANNKPFLDRVGIYFKQLAKQLLPHEIQNGGNILMTQVENEYGSYGNDHEYMANVKKTLENAGFAGPFFTCDGGSLFERGTIPGVLAGANGSAGDDLFAVSNKHFGGGPYIVPEAYPGWLDHWGEAHSKVSTESVVRDLNWYLSHNVSFNFY